MTVEHHKPRRDGWGFKMRPRQIKKGAAKRILSTSSNARIRKAWAELQPCETCGGESPTKVCVYCKLEQEAGRAGP